MSRQLLFFFFLSIFCVSCSRWDLRETCDIPYAPESRWNPPCYTKECVDDEEMELTFPESVEPLQTTNLIDIALCNNPETHASWARARSAAFDWLSARSKLYPYVDVDAAVLTEDPRSRDSEHDRSFDDRQVFDGNIVASYLLFDFGGRCANIEAARHALNSVNWSHNRVIQNVVIHVLQSYYAYIDAQASFEAKKQDLKDAEANLEAAHHLYKSGITNVVDILQARSNLLGIQLELEEIRGEVSICMGALSNALGLPADVELNVAKLSEDVPLEHVTDSVGQLMEQAKKCRPDLAAAQAYHEQKKADLKVAYAAEKPVLTADVGYHRTIHSRHAGDDYRVFRGVVGINFPLFSGFLYKNQQRGARANVDVAYAEMKGIESDIYLEVVTSYNHFRMAVEKFKYSEQFLEFTQKTYDATLSNYKEGVSTILDVLASQNALASARAQWIQARTEWLTALASLAYATGTL